MATSDFSNDQYFKSLVVEETSEGLYTAKVSEKKISELPAGELLIRVHYSGLNYKDALSFSGHRGITRRYPHTPGIDAAGVVVESSCAEFSTDDEVIVTGYDLGMNTSGGFAEFIRVPARWVVHKPKNLSLKESMIAGTSGFTAATAVLEIINHGITPDSGKVLVTGASGAVGSIGVTMLAQAGFRVVASTGKTATAAMLEKLGANEIIGREDTDDKSGRPLLPPRWIASLDTVGGNTLSTIIRSTAERGIVTNCGMLASDRLDVSVFPFILRAVRLVGIASAETPMDRRLEIWKFIADSMDFTVFENFYQIIGLNEVPEALNTMLKSASTGKFLVRL